MRIWAGLQVLRSLWWFARATCCLACLYMYKGDCLETAWSFPGYSAAGPPGTAMPPRPWEQQGNLRVHHRCLPGALAAAGSSEALFWSLFGDGSGTTGGDGGAADTFWLDSATPDRSRFSFMGGRGGSLWRRVEFRLPPVCAAASQQQQQHKPEQQQRPTANGAAVANGHYSSGGAGGGGAAPPLGTLTLTASNGTQEQLDTHFFDWLEGLLASHRCAVR